jgi:hypothetical protein
MLKIGYNSACSVFHQCRSLAYIITRHVHISYIYQFSAYYKQTYFQTYLFVLQTANYITGNAENTLYIEVESRLRNISQVVISARNE